MNAARRIRGRPWSRMPPAVLVGIAVLAMTGACSGRRASPTAPGTGEPVPALVRTLMDANCTICHRPNSGVIPGGQAPFFTSEEQLQRSRARTAIRIRDGTMPRDVADPFGDNPFQPLPPVIADLILEWAAGP